MIVTERDVHLLLASDTLDLAAVVDSPVGRMVRGFARRHVRDGVHVDVAIEVVLRFWKGRESFRMRYGLGGFVRWMQKLTAYAAAEHWRAELRRPDRYEMNPRMLGFVMSYTPSIEERLVLQAILDTVLAALQGDTDVLHPAERDVLHAIGVEEREVPDAARVLQVSTDTVYAHLSRGRAKLRVHLEHLGLLQPGEKIIRDRLVYDFMPDSGVSVARPASWSAEFSEPAE